MPNSFGLYDMHGNLWEWVEDCWNPSYAGAPSDGSAWLDGECELRMLRGGSWRTYTGGIRFFIRDSHVTRHRSNMIGFRVARTLDP